MSQLLPYKIYSSIFQMWVMCFDQACYNPDVIYSCAAPRIALLGEGVGVCVCVCVGMGGWAKGLFINCGVNAESHTSSGPVSKTRRDPGAESGETETAILACWRSEESGFVITATFFLKILWQVKESWGWMDTFVCGTCWMLEVPRDSSAMGWFSIQHSKQSENFSERNRRDYLLSFDEASISYLYVMEVLVLSPGHKSNAPFTPWLFKNKIKKIPQPTVTPSWKIGPTLLLFTIWSTDYAAVWVYYVKDGGEGKQLTGWGSRCLSTSQIPAIHKDSYVMDSDQHPLVYF